MIRSRSFALVDTESKVSACTHMPIVRYEDARFSKRDDSVIQEAELTVFVNGARQCDTTCSPWDVRELVAIERGRVTVRHATDAGIELVEVSLPAVLTVAKDIAQPRMLSIAGVRAAAGVPVAVLSAACVQADPARSGLAGSPTQVVRSFVPERSDTCEVLEGSVPQQAARIIALAEVAGL